MTNRLLVSAHRLGTLAVVGWLAVAPASGQAPAVSNAKNTTSASTWTPPRTADGQPDLGGIWANNAATPLERPKELADRPFLTDEEVADMTARAARLFGENAGDAAFGDSVYQAVLADLQAFKSRSITGDYSTVWMVPREFENRTSLILDPSDGRVPALTPDAQTRQAAAAAARLRPPSGPEDLSLQVRCITYGVPRVGGLAAGYNSYYQISQAPGYVVIAMEMIHDARIIALDGRPHLPQSVRLWHGDSRGRWEGNTLVVDTTNFSPKSNFMGASDKLHMVERFTRVAPDVLEYEITLSDPTTWTRPWTSMIRLKQTQDAVYEYACHEGNESLGGILRGARADERAADEAAKK